MKFGFIAKHRSVWPVAWLCEALGVSRSGFHAWLKRGPCARSREDDAIMPAVKASFVASARTYGARRVWRDVLEAKVSCGLHKIERVMRAQALRARPRRRTLPKDDGERSASAIAPKCARSPVQGRQAQPQMDRRLHLSLDRRGLALCRRGDRSVFAPRRRLVDEGRDERATRHRRVVNGDLAARVPGCITPTVVANTPASRSNV